MEIPVSISRRFIDVQNGWRVGPAGGSVVASGRRSSTPCRDCSSAPPFLRQITLCHSCWGTCLLKLQGIPCMKAQNSLALEAALEPLDAGRSLQKHGVSVLLLSLMHRTVQQGSRIRISPACTCHLDWICSWLLIFSVATYSERSRLFALCHWGRLATSLLQAMMICWHEEEVCTERETHSHPDPFAPPRHHLLHLHRESADRFQANERGARAFVNTI
jgi:hypothetical protein